MSLQTGKFHQVTRSAVPKGCHQTDQQLPTLEAEECHERCQEQRDSPCLSQLLGAAFAAGKAKVGVGEIWGAPAAEFAQVGVLKPKIRLQRKSLPVACLQRGWG